MNLEQAYDVIVVGAGPAGSVTARFAAENGASVLILERDREAGIPVRCAEGISVGGIEQFIEIDDKFIAARISAARIFTPDGNCLDMKSKNVGFVLDRRLFDNELCNIACAKGAIMKTKTNVINAARTEDGGVLVSLINQGKSYQVKCKILIGADGVESRVGRWLGLKTNLNLDDISTSVQYTLNNIKIDNSCLDFYFGNNVAPGGYAWVFPKSANSANVGLGIAGSFSSEKGPGEYLEEFVAKRFPNASINCTVYSGIPISATLKEIVSDNLMLVGDAARQVNPVTGGGIKQAMVAGKIAGEVAAEAVKTNNLSADFLKKYAKEWERVLGSKHRFMYKIKEKVLHAPDERLNKIAALCRSVPQEQLSLTEMFKQVIKGDPMMVAEMAKAFVLSKINF